MRDEWKRQMCRPLFWGILIGSILLNMWILANFGGQRELVRKSREIWDELQLPLSEETAEKYLEALEPTEEKHGVRKIREDSGGEQRKRESCQLFCTVQQGLFCIVFQMDSPCLYPGKYTGRGIAHDAECQ